MLFLKVLTLKLRIIIIINQPQIVLPGARTTEK